MNDPLQLNPRRRYELVVDMTIVLSNIQFTCVIKQRRPGNGRVRQKALIVLPLVPQEGSS
ncbi:RPM1-interacting protein 4-like isoform X1 [Iris pallida]|uniref:RPM1-interacting protein 4-like isoform X1 n=1 Tax=Iris pallida TaxID=29817 RepID=A0AAX6F3S0_IRIPA|nr:RPM1-interacting protein 4-like isoform X1 [Iris pallida]KAJ6840903.1 RPM1-interacting protein 4-like isoform X1 [Iris pallida]